MLFDRICKENGIRHLLTAAHSPTTTGEVVAIKRGHIVDAARLAELPERLQNSEIRIAEGFHLVALTEDEYEPVMLFLNHSCDPNVGLASNGWAIQPRRTCRR